MDRADFYDAELRRHNEHFRAALEAQPGDRVLDIGCGAGQSTREVARIAAEGEVIGLDVSEELLQVARRRSAEEGLQNVTFAVGDAQVQAFPAAYFDLCVSRFGVMFFADPVAAFTNLGRAMRPGGRLILMVWQGQDRNEWSSAIQAALTPGGIPSARAGAAFSLGDPVVTTKILASAGFVSIDFVEVNEPVFYGPTVDAAYDAVAGLYLVKDSLTGSDATNDGALQRLRTVMDAHLTPDGVFFDSHAWIVSARRAAGVANEPVTQ